MLGPVIDRSGGERGERKGARHARPAHFDCGPPWLADGSGGRGPFATSDSGSGKVAARVDCNWFIIINDDLLYGMETVFV